MPPLLLVVFVRVFIKMKTSLLVNQSTEMQTCPPPRAIFSALVTQWAIYDRWDFVLHLVELSIFGSRFQSEGLNWNCKGTWLMRLPRRRRRTERRRPSKRFFLLSCRFFCEKKVKTSQKAQRTREFIASDRHQTVTKPYFQAVAKLSSTSTSTIATRTRSKSFASVRVK